jgi:hypothetical protein
MPSFMTIVENKPIVFNAYLQRTSSEDLQDTFRKMQKMVRKSGMTWLILDLTGWDITHQDLTSLVGALAIRQAGSPYDHGIVPLVVCPSPVIHIMKKFLADHKARYEMLHFDNLNEAYEFALEASELSTKQ